MLRNINKLFSNKNLLISGFLFFIIVILFWDLTKTFYQQDEWHGLGDILALGWNAIFIQTDPIQIILGQGRIFAHVVVYILLGTFPFNIVPVAIFAIVIHSLNTILVYFLAKKLIGEILPPLLGALFFAFNSVSAGAVIWSASGVGTIPAATLVILSLFSFLKFLESDQRKWILLTFILIYLSLFFKEIGLFLFLFLPVYYFLINGFFLKKVYLNFWPFLIFCLITVSVGLSEFQSIPVQKDLFLTGSSNNFFLTLFTRAIFYPLTSFSLIYMPTEIAFNFAKHITWIYYPFLPSNLYDLVAQTALLDTIAIFLSLIIFFTFFILFQNSKLEVKNRIIFLILFILFSFLPYIIIGKSFAYLESRYYYLAALASGILLGFLISKISKYSNISKIFVLVLTLLFLLLHIRVVETEINKQKENASERKGILTQIKNIKPKLNEKTVFYLTGDRNFYITEGNPVPMQQGMGFTLLVWYYDNEAASKDLIKLIEQYFLWEMNGQGYKEVGNTGYGYFWNLGELKSTMKKSEVDKENIVGLYYDSKKKEIVDITSQTLEKI